MIDSEFTRKESQEYEKWLREMSAAKRLAPTEGEKEREKKKRIEHLLNNPIKFLKYYFEEYIKADFSWFHKAAIRDIINNPDIYYVAEWPREHAKSVLFDIMIPMYLLAKQELTGMMIASANQDKANRLLSDIQGELMINKRFEADFGVQYASGKWTDGYFVTTGGIGFYAFGLGQSPRGTRTAEKRPNYGVADDLDTATMLRNPGRCREAADWVNGDFYFAMPTKQCRMVVAGNRIGKTSIMAQIVGNIEPDDPIKEEITYSRVYALENPKTHEKDLSEDGVPAWKENYTREDIFKKMKKVGYRLGLREFFHETIIEGSVFTEEDLPWAKLPHISHYERLITYNDPSFKSKKSNDFKAIVLIGKYDKYYDIIKAFCRQCKPAEMVRGHYELAEQVPENKACRHYMEANFMQDILLDEYDIQAGKTGHHIGIVGDHRKKPDKIDRIEALSALTERRQIRFNIKEKNSADMQEIRNQFLGFPDYKHDDGPDAVEGGVYILNKKKGVGKEARTGSYRQNQSRRG